MNDMEKRKRQAIKIALSINPDAQLAYTTNQFGKTLCNEMSLDECRVRCAAADEEFTREGNEEAARVVHELPLFVFAMLSKEEITKFVSVWMLNGGKEN